MSARARLALLWPLALVLGGEGVALAWALRAGGGLPITPFALFVAGCSVAVCLLPVLLRPSPSSVVAGCFGLCFAGFIAVPYDFVLVQRTLTTTGVVPAVAWLRLANGLLAALLGLHLSTLLVVPNPTPRGGRALLVAYAGTALLLALLALPLLPLRLLLWPLLLLWAGGLLGVTLRQLWQATRERAPERLRVAQQARLLLFSATLAGLSFLIRPLSLLVGSPIPYTVPLLLLLLPPLGIGYAIARHDLFGIDAALRRATAYTLVSLLWLALYLALTVGLTALFARTWAEWRGLAALGALLVAAAAFGPLRRRVQRAVDDLFYPERLRFQREIAATQAALARVVRREEVVALLTRDLPDRLGSRWASLALAPQPEVPGGQESQPAWNAPLVVGGEGLGRYWLGPRHGGLPYDADEQAQLASVVQQAALTLAYAATFEALATLNEELEARVTARTEQLLAQQRALAVLEERQRLARDLHDSVTQTLFSVSLSLRAIRNLLRRDPEAAHVALGEQEQAAQQALGEMRALLSHLRHEPPALEDVAQALASHCDALARQGQLTVHLELPPSFLLPAPLAHDLLHLAREALHNVLKHAGSAEATCTLTCDSGVLTLTVQDHGRGFNLAIPTPGMGLRGMQERVATHGGTLTLVSAPGAGTTVQVEVSVNCE